MDFIYVLGEEDRSAFLPRMIQAFGCTYICLRTYLPQFNCLLFMDGVYVEESSQQPSSSTGRVSRRLFDAYCKSTIDVDLGRVPGLAMQNSVPYIEMKLPDLLRLTSSQVQLQFFQEAGIKTVVLMGCSRGEVELGFSTDPQVNVEIVMRSWFPSHFSTQTPSQELLQPISSSSAAASASFHTPTPSNQSRNIQIPTILDSHEADDVMKNAMIAVLSSDTSPHQNLASNITPVSTSYHVALGPDATTLIQKNDNYTRTINTMRTQDLQVQENQPSSSQRQHVMSERRRREKLKEGFQILRSLLPPGTKKDTASVLGSTIEYINMLQSEMDELLRTNQILKSQLSTAIQREGGDQELGFSSSSDQKVINVEMAPVSSSTSGQARSLDLRVTLRTSDMIIRVLEFLKQQRNVAFLSMQSNTRTLLDSTTVHGLVLRFQTQGDEFDEADFKEALRRIVEGQPY